MQGKFDAKLGNAGVSEETRDALHADLSAAFEAQMSSGTRPNPAAMKETISDIFAEHGLNAADFMPQQPPRVYGMGGMMGALDAGGSKAESIQALLKSLQVESDEGSKANLADTNAVLMDMSEQVLSIMLGIDTEV
jgi:hypothetical protein